MAIYYVTCSYRKDDGMNYSFSTYKDVVAIQADSLSEARMKALFAMYERHSHCSHVRIGTIKEEEGA